MDHREAIDKHAAERYLLGEMSELEQHLFEEHYFSCAVCAEEVRTGTIFREAARSVLAENRGEAETEGHTAVATAPGARTKPPAPPKTWQDQGGWFDWLRPANLIPLAAALSLVCITAWQSLITIPQLRMASAPEAAAPVVLALATRGELPVVPTTGKGVVPVSVYLSGGAAPVAFDLRAKDGTLLHSGTGPAPAPGAPLVIFLPASAMKQSGEHRLSVRDASAGQSLGEYLFSIEHKQ